MEKKIKELDTSIRFAFYKGKPYYCIADIRNFVSSHFNMNIERDLCNRPGINLYIEELRVQMFCISWFDVNRVLIDNNLMDVDLIKQYMKNLKDIYVKYVYKNTPHLNKDEIISHYGGDYSIYQDGWYNITKMFQYVGAKVNHWYDTRMAMNTIYRAAQQNGVEYSEVIKVKKGGNKSGSWAREWIIGDIDKWLQKRYDLRSKREFNECFGDIDKGEESYIPTDELFKDSKSSLDNIKVLGRPEYAPGTSTTTATPAEDCDDSVSDEDYDKEATLLDKLNYMSGLANHIHCYLDAIIEKYRKK